MFKLSLRVQLSLWVVLIFTLIQWISTLVVWVILSRAIYQSFNDYLLLHSVGVSTAVRSELPNPSAEFLDELESDQLAQVRFHVYYIDVYDQTGARVIKDRPMLAQLELETIQHALDNPGPVLLDQVFWANPPDSITEQNMVISIQRVLARDGTPFIVLQATDDAYAQSRVVQMGQTLLITSLATPFLALLAGWFISSIAISPITRVQELLSNLTIEKLEKPIEAEDASTEVMELAAQLDESRDKLKSAFKSQARFISNVSHELKTPIAVMQIESETLDLEHASEDVRDFVHSTRKEMTRLGKMIESFLTLTRLEDGFGKVNGKRYAYNDLVMDSIDQCIAMSDQNAIQLNPVLFADEDTMVLSIMGDSDLLITMLNNLVRNAIRYSPASGEVRIELRHLNTETKEKRVQIAVSDQGPGIPSDKIEHIFDRFAKVEGSDRSGRGHGLGLAIAQGIAELHGGQISAQNNPDAGCTFTVDLPAVQDSES